MHYAILCYASEEIVCAWTAEQERTAVEALDAVGDKLRRQGRLGPVVRLMPTTTAATVRKDKEALVLDGPFAETKEQLLGLFIVDCDSLEHAIEVAKELASAGAPLGSYEIRPLRAFEPGLSLSAFGPEDSSA
jgi:hypothetical protein